jgi:hypothetical protein
MFLDNDDEIFNQWNDVKKRTQEKTITAYFREREIYWANLGKNIDYEQNGKGKDFMRPLLIFRKYLYQQQLEKVAFFIILIF